MNSRFLCLVLFIKIATIHASNAPAEYEKTPPSLQFRLLSTICLSNTICGAPHNNDHEDTNIIPTFSQTHQISLTSNIQNHLSTLYHTPCMQNYIIPFTKKMFMKVFGLYIGYNMAYWIDHHLFEQRN